jgi:chaperonin GroEL (HSP60 family)
MNPMDLKRGIDMAVAEVVKAIADLKRSKKINTSEKSPRSAPSPPMATPKSAR